MASELATAYLTLYPKLSDGFGREASGAVAKSLDGKSVGGEFGTQAGTSFNAGLSGTLSKFVLPAAIVTTLVGVGKAGFDAYSQVEEGANNVILATGATGDAAKELTDVYKQVAGSVKGDFGDIGAAVGELNTRLGINGDALESASEAAMKFAKVNGVDAKSAVADVTRMMNNAGISADEYESTLDKLTVAAQQSGIDVSSLASNVTANAASFKELGFSTDESIALLANFEKVGANSSQVLAGMKKGVAEWAKEGLSAKDGFASFVRGVQDGTVSSADAIELFGSRAGMTMYDAASKGQLDFEAMYAAIAEGSAGMTEQMYNDTLTATEKMDLAWQNVTLAGAELFAPIADAFSAFLSDVVVPFAQSLTGYVDGIKSGIEGSGITAAVSEAASSIQASVQPVVEWVGANVVPLVQEVAGTVGPIVQQIASDVQSALPEVQAAFEEAFGAIGGLVQDVWPSISETVSAVMEVVKTVVPPVWNAIKANLTASMNAIRGIMQTVWPAISGIVTTAANTIKNVIAGISSVVGTVQGIFNRVKSAIADPINTAKQLISDAIDKIKSIFSGLKLELPSIKLPHFSVSGGEAPYGIGGKGSLPQFSVDWYAKGGIVDGASIIGVGERGAELVWPSYDPYISKYAEAIADAMPTGGGITVNLNYTNDADAAAMARDVAWEIRRYELAGAF